MNTKFKKSAFCTILFIFSAMAITSAQTDVQKSVKEKLAGVKGDLERIIIETNDGEIEFEGEEADYLFKRLKSPSKLLKKLHHKMKGDILFFDDDSNKSIEKVKVMNLKKGDHTAFFSDDDEFVWNIYQDSLDENSKKVEVKIENGEKSVTITTVEDGEEKVETLTGEDAEAYLEKHKGKDLMFFKKGKGKTIHLNKTGKILKWKDEDDGDIMIIENIGDDEAEIDVSIKDENGEMKVTVTKVVDGEIEVTEYTGEKAEEFLKNNDEGNTFIIKLDSDDSDSGHVFVKKMYKKILNGDEDFEWFGDNDMLKSKIEVEIDDSLNTVTVITSEDGEEKVTVYEGEDAEKFLDEHGDDELDINFGKNNGNIIKIKKMKNIDEDEVFKWIEKDDGNGNSKTIKYYTEDGVKKLKIITVEEGEEKTENYEGNEAIEKFKQLNKENKINIKSKGEKSFKKIIIK